MSTIALVRRSVQSETADDLVQDGEAMLKGKITSVQQLVIDYKEKLKNLEGTRRLKLLVLVMKLISMLRLKKLAEK